MAQDTPRKPVGKQPVPSGRYPGKPLTKKQRRSQSAARSVSLERRKPWQSPTIVTTVSVAVVAVVLIVIVLINQVGAGNAVVATQVPPAILNAVEHPSPTVVNTVGTGGQPGQMIRMPASAKLLDAHGNPLIVFVGAEYCPYCAAERWSIVMWLSRFGTFHNLSEMTSSSSDAYPNTNTFTFHKASYTSPYLTFSANELQDRNQAQLESMTTQIANIFTKYDNPPYTSESGQYPFINIGGVFSLHSTSYSPALLEAGSTPLSWSQIAAKLSNPSDPVTQAIVGNANILTAATCIATGDSPASVCSPTTSNTIQAIENALKAIKPS